MDQVQESQAKKSTSEVINALRERAAKNDVFNAICYVFAQRKRTRRQVTVSALKQAMEHEGADFTVNDYIETLKFLADLGLGKPKINAKGQFIGLGDIKVTLQSIGQAAAAKRPDLEKFHQQPASPQFIDLTDPEALNANLVIDTKEVKHILRKAVETKKDEVQKQTKEVAEVHKSTNCVCFLTLYSQGKKTVFQGDTIKTADLGEFLMNYRALVEGKRQGNA